MKLSKTICVFMNYNYYKLLQSLSSLNGVHRSSNDHTICYLDFICLQFNLMINITKFILTIFECKKHKFIYFKIIS